MTLSEQAYRSISRMIQERTLHTGEAVVEQSLAERLQVSRTPLRQALQRLASEGLLLKTANRSFVVRQVELKEYLQSLKVRELLESEAAFLAVDAVPIDAIAKARENLKAVMANEPYDMNRHWASDEEVHGLFIDHCGNAVMAQMIRSLRSTTKLFEIERLSERLEPDARQHEAILTALEERNAKATRRAVSTHIKSLFKFAVATIR